MADEPVALPEEGKKACVSMEDILGRGGQYRQKVGMLTQQMKRVYLNIVLQGEPGLKPQQGDPYDDPEKTRRIFVQRDFLRILDRIFGEKYFVGQNVIVRGVKEINGYEGAAWIAAADGLNIDVDVEKFENDYSEQIEAGDRMLRFLSFDLERAEESLFHFKRVTHKRYPFPLFWLPPLSRTLLDQRRQQVDRHLEQQSLLFPLMVENRMERLTTSLREWDQKSNESAFRALGVPFWKHGKDEGILMPPDFLITIYFARYPVSSTRTFEQYPRSGRSDGLLLEQLQKPLLYCSKGQLEHQAVYIHLLGEWMSKLLTHPFENQDHSGQTRPEDMKRNALGASDRHSHNLVGDFFLRCIREYWLLFGRGYAISFDDVSKQRELMMSSRIFRLSLAALVMFCHLQHGLKHSLSVTALSQQVSRLRKKGIIKGDSFDFRTDVGFSEDELFDAIPSLPPLVRDLQNPLHSTLEQSLDPGIPLTSELHDIIDIWLLWLVPWRQTSNGITKPDRAEAFKFCHKWRGTLSLGPRDILKLAGQDSLKKEINVALSSVRRWFKEGDQVSQAPVGVSDFRGTIMEDATRGWAEALSHRLSSSSPRSVHRGIFDEYWRQWVIKNYSFYTDHLSLFLQRATTLDFSGAMISTGEEEGPDIHTSGLDLLERVLEVYEPSVVEALKQASVVVGFHCPEKHMLEDSPILKPEAIKAATDDRLRSINQDQRTVLETCLAQHLCLMQRPYPSIRLDDCVAEAIDPQKFVHHITEQNDMGEVQPPETLRLYLNAARVITKLVHSMIAFNKERKSKSMFRFLSEPMQDLCEKICSSIGLENTREARTRFTLYRYQYCAQRLASIFGLEGLMLELVNSISQDMETSPPVRAQSSSLITPGSRLRTPSREPLRLRNSSRSRMTSVLSEEGRRQLYSGRSKCDARDVQFIGHKSHIPPLSCESRTLLYLTQRLSNALVKAIVDIQNGSLLDPQNGTQSRIGGRANNRILEWLEVDPDATDFEGDVVVSSVGVHGTTPNNRKGSNNESSFCRRRAEMMMRLPPNYFRKFADVRYFLAAFVLFFVSGCSLLGLRSTVFFLGLLVILAIIYVR